MNGRAMRRRAFGSPICAPLGKLVPTSGHGKIQCFESPIFATLGGGGSESQSSAKPPPKPRNDRYLTGQGAHAIDLQFATRDSRFAIPVWHAAWLRNRRNNALRNRLFDGRYEGC